MSNARNFRPSVILYFPGLYCFLKPTPACCIPDRDDRYRTNSYRVVKYIKSHSPRLLFSYTQFIYKSDHGDSSLSVDRTFLPKKRGELWRALGEPLRKRHQATETGQNSTDWCRRRVNRATLPDQNTQAQYSRLTRIPFPNALCRLSSFKEGTTCSKKHWEEGNETVSPGVLVAPKIIQQLPWPPPR